MRYICDFRYIRPKKGAVVAGGRRRAYLSTEVLCNYYRTNNLFLAKKKSTRIYLFLPFHFYSRFEVFIPLLLLTHSFFSDRFGIALVSG